MKKINIEKSIENYINKTKLKTITENTKLGRVDLSEFVYDEKRDGVAKQLTDDDFVSGQQLALDIINKSKKGRKK